MDRYEEALRSYVDALNLAIFLRLESETVQSAFNIVDILRRKREYQAAVEFLDNVIERYPDYWSAYAERANVYLDMERYPEAIRNYATACG